MNLKCQYLQYSDNRHPLQILLNHNMKNFTVQLVWKIIWRPDPFSAMYTASISNRKDLKKFLKIKLSIVREFGMDIYTLYLKWITNKDLLYSTWNSKFNVMWHPEWEGSLGKNGNMLLYGWVPLLFTWNYHNSDNWLHQLTKYKIKS